MKSHWNEPMCMEKALNQLAARLPEGGRSLLRLRPDCALRLRRRLKQVDLYCREGAEGDAINRLCGDARRIEACLEAARGERAIRLPGRGSPRVLMLARLLVGEGAHSLDRDRLMEAIAVFENARPLRMRELESMPQALRIALCEGFAAAVGEVLALEEAARLARRWVERGGRLPKKCSDAFLAHAERLCIEGEQGKLLNRLAEKRRLEDALEAARNREARLVLRIENLLKLHLLLEKLDWSTCFEALSAVERELQEDEIYAASDAASRAQLRSALAGLAAALGMEEAGLARLAMQLAREEGDTVCRCLAEDDGRLALCRAAGKRLRLRRRIPDPTGKGSAALALTLFALLLVICCRIIGTPLLMVNAVPAAWCLSQQLLHFVSLRLLRPRPLLKLRLRSLPEEGRTLVALPVLLSSEKRAGEMIEHMEALGCLEKDPNIDFLLLGDFKDAATEFLPEDQAILDAARRGVARLNAQAGREKYFYLHRGRSLRARDEKWMGEGRKRGALAALNRLILEKEGAAAAFSAEGACSGKLAGRYRFVLTLDADTALLPGTIHRLVGAMLHPLNRRYALLQPCMRSTLAENVYARLCAGTGGVDGYPCSVSDFDQDMTGQGNFAGKGIYDVRAFAAATDGVLPDEEILSHDLIEGMLCGAGFVSDVCFFDAAPESLGAELGRLHRWTRGDWQLLRVLFSGLPLSFYQRLKLAGNLLRSLHAPALMALLVGGVWLDAPGALLLALITLFTDGLLAPFDTAAWRRGVLRLETLPAFAARQSDAILRALWRLFVSRKHLLDWTPAADQGAGDAALRVYGRATALLLLPGLLRPGWIPAALGLVLLFWVGVDRADDLARQKTERPAALTEGQRQLLHTLAEETWHFFETYVPEDGTGLPPDNVQFDPPAGVAARTSPTNIGLYLLSCVSAAALGLISLETMRSRMEASVASIEKMEKWQGHLYNWMDVDTLAPLRPRYVSAVDSGNLAAALLLCAQAAGGALGGRMTALAENMRLDALYDREKNLFYIGMDVENGCMSQAHYDLYASESRILSYAAMMLGQVPLKHWQRLGRRMVSVGRECALLSWSGTMFEYLMPELLLRSPAASLAGASRRGAVHAQIARGKERQRPWGVSESGYYAFDLQLNYQYRAFGLRMLALSGSAQEDVTAPYASALALCCAPGAAADNLLRMRSLGWSGPFGMFEAADYHGGEAHLVKSCMAHHQGMILCAVCNALKEDVLPKLLMRDPRARALKLLLEEGFEPRRRLRVQRRNGPALRRCCTTEKLRRRARPGDAHMLCGGGVSALVTARGAAFVRRGSLLLNPFSGDLSGVQEGAYVHLEDTQSGAKTVFGASGDAFFEAGSACFRENIRGVEAELKLALSPENGVFYQIVELKNGGREERTLEITSCMPVALAQEGDFRAHAVFQKLFIESRRTDGGVIFRRRPREAGQRLPELAFLCSRDAAWETSREQLIGRTGSFGLPGGLARDLQGTLGNVIDPCGALRCRVRLGGGESARLHFVLHVADQAEAEGQTLLGGEAAERALQLSMAHARALLRQLCVDEGLWRLAGRAAAWIADARLRPTAAAPCEPLGREALWQAGISGDRPILLMELRSGEQNHALHGLIRLHAYFRAMGLETDLALVDLGGGGYLRPVRDGLEQMIGASHLHDLRGVPGGVFLLDGDHMGLDAVRRAAVLRLNDGQSLAAQLRGLADALPPEDAPAWTPMEAVHRQRPEGLAFFNGCGGFDGENYRIALREGRLPPAPWSNILASEHGGAVITDRGGGFAWRENSRSGRLTPYGNDALREGWGWMLYLLDGEERTWTRLLPGEKPMTDFDLCFAPNHCHWEGGTAQARFSVEAAMQAAGISFTVELENTGRKAADWKLLAAVEWLLGADAADRCMLRTWQHSGACFASGAAGIGLLAADSIHARPGCDLRLLCAGGDLNTPRGFDALESGRGGQTILVPVKLRPGEKCSVRFLIGGAENIAGAMVLLHAFRRGQQRQEPQRILRIETPDAGLNALVNGFLPAQLKYARILARTGLYQPGGAYGFRDQLQDMLPLIYTEPERVRAHLLRCAAKQFEAGDVLHWWHEPATGVRTHISDDLLFLPFVAAQYVSVTGDEGVLSESVPFLKEVEIPEGREDIYACMEESRSSASLHEHCMRAFRRAGRTGEHGLCRMGSGDWNDGMNRVGAHGRGESIWLSQFLAVCAADYARVAPDAEDRAWLYALNERMCAAVEAQGWDGAWYLRAYADDGSVLGGRSGRCCSIDLISQAWAVLAGLDGERCASAMDAAWALLADEQAQLIRLLTPPFDGQDFDPGYIAAYPPGVRENGAQYTHAACWFVLALIRMGDAARAHRALSMLLPVHHAATEEAMRLYRVEPYVMAADVYSDGAHAGRGGWTWYTGSAAWMLMAVYALLGFERRGNRVRLHALLGPWKEASLTLEYGGSSYCLICREDAQQPMLDGMPLDADWLEMEDDGRAHQAIFPPRKPCAGSRDEMPMERALSGKK